MDEREWLIDYFTNHWPQSRKVGLDKFYWTGWRLVYEVKEGERVLDVGCGSNPFRGHIPLLTGIDITDIGSDEQVAIEDYFTKEKYDVAFALGSINFGSWETILEQTMSLVRCMKDDSRIYWRCNPGKRDHGNDKVNEVPFFEWNIWHHIILSQLFGYEIIELMPDNNRMYVKWERKSLSISPKMGE